MRRFAAILLWLSCAVLAATAASTPAKAEATVQPSEWNLYKARFLDPAGRIVDNANGNISHSEGQGYGLLLSYLADDRGDFDRIWSFTRTEMLVRNDGLAAWKWDPLAKPHVSDTNNATDGDLLMAYSLSLAGAAWHRPDLTSAASAMATAILASDVERAGGLLLLKPGSVGFGAKDRKDGPVVNPSYWVFEAFPVLAAQVPDQTWSRLDEDGRKLIATAMGIGKAGLPPDWVSLRAKPSTAGDLSNDFGYNALRVPLYLLRSGNADGSLLRTLRQRMADEDGNLLVVDISSGEKREALSDPGYRIIPALIACALDGRKLADDLKSFSPTDYYPSTLHLLALSYARRRHAECL